MINILIFASGSGTNADNLFKHLSKDDKVNIVGLVVDRNCGAIDRLRGKCDIYLHNPDGEGVLQLIKNMEVDVILLAGFLSLVPTRIISLVKGNVLNIHPALLPKYGGKGMYGMNVHKAVIAAGEKESGITVHKVNQKYDDGDIVLQATCPVLEDDTPEKLASRIHQLEYEYYPKAVDQFLKEYVHNVR